QIGAEGAEGAAVDADVGRVEVLVDVVKRALAVFAFADEVGQFAEREEVGVGVELKPILRREANGGVNFLGDLSKMAIHRHHPIVFPYRRNRFPRKESTHIPLTISSRALISRSMSASVLNGPGLARTNPSGKLPTAL